MRTLIDFDDAPVFMIPTADGVREGVLLEGPQGWGEFSPPPDSEDSAAARWLTAAMEPGTVGWPDATRGRIPVAVGVPETDPATAYRLAAGSRCARVSAAMTRNAAGANADRLAAVRNALGPRAALRCVVQVGDDVDVTVASIAQLDRAAGGLELVELLCRNVEDAVAVRRGVHIPVAVDATLLSEAGRRGEAADIAVLRCGPLGGVRRALRRAEMLGLPCLVNLAGKTSVGLAADVALAAALPNLPYTCGPSAVRPADGDVVAEMRSLVPTDGYLPAAPMPAAPEPARLAEFRVTDPSKVQHWRGLLRRASAVG
ncbi:MAG: O-succinylbenzoate-CoA synthase [Actinomycetia bacterium]|nr:O-succinylbenzoate-CoA synthase [Actinomycetes bacterium]